MSQKYGVKIVFSKVKKDRLVGQLMAVVAAKREAWRAECIGPTWIALYVSPNIPDPRPRPWRPERVS